MSDLVGAVASWRALLGSLLIFGFAPGAITRVLALAFRKEDPRRAELLGELYAVPRWERPLWVAQQLEVAIFEGIGSRLSHIKSRVMARRAKQPIADLALPLFTFFTALVAVLMLAYIGTMEAGVRTRGVVEVAVIAIASGMVLAVVELVGALRKSPLDQLVVELNEVTEELQAFVRNHQSQ